MKTSVARSTSSRHPRLCEAGQTGFLPTMVSGICQAPRVECVGPAVQLLCDRGQPSETTLGLRGLQLSPTCGHAVAVLHSRRLSRRTQTCSVISSSAPDSRAGATCTSADAQHNVTSPCRGHHESKASAIWAENTSSVPDTAR